LFALILSTAFQNYTQIHWKQKHLRYHFCAKSFRSLHQGQLWNHKIINSCFNSAGLLWAMARKISIHDKWCNTGRKFLLLLWYICNCCLASLYVCVCNIHTHIWRDLNVSWCGLSLGTLVFLLYGIVIVIIVNYKDCIEISTTCIQIWNLWPPCNHFCQSTFVG